MESGEKNISWWLIVYAIRELGSATESELAHRLFALYPKIEILHGDLELLWRMGLVEIEQAKGMPHRLRATRYATDFLDRSWENLKDVLAHIVSDFQRAQ